MEDLRSCLHITAPGVKLQDHESSSLSHILNADSFLVHPVDDDNKQVTLPV